MSRHRRSHQRGLPAEPVAHDPAPPGGARAASAPPGRRDMGAAPQHGLSLSRRGVALARLCDPPHVSLQKIGQLVRQDYRMYCSLHGIELPPHLSRAPRQLPGWDGSIDRSGAGRHSIWERIARSCLRRRVDPRHVLRVTEGACMESGYPPPPEALLMEGLEPPVVAGWARSSQVRQIERIRLDLRHIPTEMSALRADYELDEREAFRRALLNRESLMSPLCRLTCAWPMGECDIVERFLEESLLEYLIFRDVAEEVLLDCLPEFFLRCGRAFYALIDSEDLGHGGGGDE